MKNPSIFPKTIPDWQTERAAKLQRACLSVQGAVGRGEKISRAIRRVSRRYHRRNYKRDRSRRLALAPGTLRRLWDKWKIGGEVPAAFKLHYYSRPPFIPRPLLIRFCEFCATRRLPSVKEAWQKFSRIRGNFTAKRISYGQVCYSFRAAEFYLMQSELKAIETAQARLNKIKFKVITDITNRLPVRAPRRRVRREITFEI